MFPHNSARTVTLMRLQPALPEGRQAVTLLAASGHGRQGHLNHVRDQCRFQVRSPEVLFTFQSQRRLDLLPGHLTDHSAQQAFDFP